MIAKIERRGSVIRISRPKTRWLHTGWRGGTWQTDYAYSVSVPSDWAGSDVASDVMDRLIDVGFTDSGPTLITGVASDHARVAIADDVEVLATAGLSNPTNGVDPLAPGTVNLVVITELALVDGARANLLAMVAEAKAMTLDRLAGVSGTSTDAIIVGDNPLGEPCRYSGSATEIGSATRSAVAAAVTSALHARYGNESLRLAVEHAPHPVDRTVDVPTKPVPKTSNSCRGL